jgi:hypothetical protein
MFYSINMVACLAAAVTPQSFDIKVPKVAPIVQGQPMEVEVSVTYRGNRPIRVAYWRYLEPCGYDLPEAWKPTSKLFSGKLLGPEEAVIEPGKRIDQLINLRLKQDFHETPGKEYVYFQCFISGSFEANGPRFLHTSKRVKVPIVIVAPPK